MWLHNEIDSAYLSTPYHSVLSFMPFSLTTAFSTPRTHEAQDMPPMLKTPFRSPLGTPTPPLLAPLHIDKRQGEGRQKKVRARGVCASFYVLLHTHI